MKKGSTKRLVLIMVAGVLIVVGAYFAHNVNSINSRQENMVNKIANYSRSAKLGSQKGSLESIYNYSDAKPLTFDSLKSGYNSKEKLPNIARVSIPNAKLSTVINEGVSNDVLSVGAGTLKPNQVIGVGNYALAGHNYFGKNSDYFLFANLDLVKKGDLIYLENKSKKETYKVNSNPKVISVNDTDEINDSKAGDNPIVTLITCYTHNGKTNYNKRLMIRGYLVKANTFNVSK